MVQIYGGEVIRQRERMRRSNTNYKPGECLLQGAFEKLGTIEFAAKFEAKREILQDSYFRNAILFLCKSAKVNICLNEAECI